MFQSVNDFAPVSTSNYLHVDMIADSDRVGIATSYNKVWYNWALIQTVFSDRLQKTLMEVDGEIMCLANVGSYLMLLKLNKHLKKGFILLHSEDADCDIENFIENINVHPRFALKENYNRHLEIHKKRDKKDTDFSLCIPELGMN